MTIVAHPYADPKRRQLAIAGAQFPGRKYLPHTRGDMAVIIAHFNPAGWKKTPQLLYDTCTAILDAGIEVVVAQLVAPHAEPARLPDGVVSAIYRSEAVLFHKENLYNLATRHTTAQKFLFLDGDVIFGRPDIFDAVSHALDTCDILQPYRTALWLDKEDRVILGKRSAADAMSMGREPLPSKVHPGFSWAMTRKFYDAIGGLYDCHPLGSGDAALSFAVFRGTPPFPKVANDAFVNTLSWQQFRARMQALSPVLGSVSGLLYHLWHGSRPKRQYSHRWKYVPLQAGQEYPLRRRDDGVLEWQDPKYNDILRSYFVSRDEDE